MSETSHAAGTKKKHKPNNGGEDYISSLPANVLSLILCRIPTKEVVRTSILNREWKDRWTSIHYVKLDSRMTINREGFLRFLESTTPKLHGLVTFKLLYWGNYDWARISACIHAILKSEIQCLGLKHLGRRTTEANVLPSSILMKTSLTKLVLVLPCIYKVPIKNIFPKMQKLSLKSIHFLNENSTDTLFFAFPILEDCCFSECEWSNVKLIEIHAPKLRSFCSDTVLDDPQVENRTIKIIGANLKEFILDGGHLETFNLTGSTVELARVLNIPPDYEDETLIAWGLHARKLLKELPGIKELKLSGLLCVAIGYPFPEVPLPFHNMLVKLELTNVVQESGLHALLHASPCLKYVSLYEDVESDDWDYERYGDREEVNVPQCLLSHLEIVKFHYYECTQARSDISKLFIKYGEVLKKFIICEYDNSDEEDIKKELSSIPRASSGLKIVLRGTVLV